MEKINVMRILDQKKIKYNKYFYGDTNAISGVEVELKDLEKVIDCKFDDIVKE